MLRKVFPFVDWAKISTFSSLKLDLVSGVTVALVLIPQSMAYAQLAGMPVHYGLYASFLPPMIGAMLDRAASLQRARWPLYRS
jgi:MFS superfamily sulfate permease-like transporter